MSDLPSPASWSRAVLTPRQDAILRECVRRGYYDIPRRTTLRALAKELGLSATSLSLLLRRAEARLALGYVSGGEEPVPAVVASPPTAGRPWSVNGAAR